MRTFDPEHNVDDAVIRAQLLTKRAFLLAYEKETTQERARDNFWSHIAQSHVGRPLYPCAATTWSDYFQDVVMSGIINAHPTHCLTTEGRSQLTAIQHQLADLNITQ